MIYQYSSHELILYMYLFCPEGLTSFVFSRHKITVLTRIIMKSALRTVHRTAYRRACYLAYLYTEVTLMYCILGHRYYMSCTEPAGT